MPDTNQLDRSTFSATEFRMDLTVGDKQYKDYSFQTFTIPGISEATSEDFKMNNCSRKIITAPGTDNDAKFTTSVTPDYFEFRQAAKDLKDYKAVLSGVAGSAFEGDTITISGKVSSPEDFDLGVEGVPLLTFVGTTNYISYLSGTIA